MSVVLGYVGNDTAEQIFVYGIVEQMNIYTWLCFCGIEEQMSVHTWLLLLWCSRTAESYTWLLPITVTTF
jgi:hypothetical protein